MKRASSIFRRAQSAKESLTQNISPDAKSKFKQVSTFLTDNQVPRYLIYSMIVVKCYTIYDKWKQLVALQLT